MKKINSQSRQSAQGKPAPTNASRKENLYQQITDKLLAQMGKGVIPWKRPWKILDNGMAEVPTNYVTKKSYRGINLMLLCCNAYSRPYYMTYRQAQSQGGQVRKGEKGHLVVFYKTLTQQEESGKDKTLFWERPSVVFNIDQIEGVEFRQPDLLTGQPDEARLIGRCEQVFTNYPNPPKLVHTCHDRAFYDPNTDEVNMPIIQAFKTPLLYYNTLFHELTHSSGHVGRLNRIEMGAGHFGTNVYRREELTAELGAAFLNCICGSDQQADSDTERYNAGYLKNYMDALKNDVTLFYKASQQAQKAVDHILNRSYENAGPVAESEEMETA